MIVHGVAEPAPAPQAPHSGYDMVAHRDHSYGNSGMSRTEYERIYKLARQDSTSGIHWDNYPPNDGAVRDTRRVFDDLANFSVEYGDRFDRIGDDGGTYLGLAPDGQPAAWEQSALSVSSFGKPVHDYRLDPNAVLPPRWTIEISRIAPGFGHPGGGLQVQVKNPDGEPPTCAGVDPARYSQVDRRGIVNIRLTDEFEVFARTAGYTVEYLEDAEEIYNLGGEIRFLVHRVDADVLVEFAERARDYSVQVHASAVNDAERYLTYVLGGSVRDVLGLPTIVTGFLSEGAPEVLITHAPRVTTLELIGDPDRKVQLFGAEVDNGEMLSYVMKSSLEELRASFAAPDGLPLFAFAHRDAVSAATPQVDELSEVGRGLFRSLAAKSGQTLDDPLNVVSFDGGVAVVRAVRGGGKIFVAEDGSVMYRGSSYTFERALEEFRAGERTPLESFR